MLETLRGYGLRRPRDTGEEQAAGSALAAHALDVAERAAAQMAVRAKELPAALWLDAEDAAVHQGLAWALDHDPPAALRLALALAPWWIVRGRCALQALSYTSLYADKGEDAVAWARQAQLVDPDLLPGWRARLARFVLPAALVASGHLDGAQDLCEELLSQARAVGELSIHASTLYLMATLASKAGQLAEAGAYLRETAELAVLGGYPLLLISVLEEGGHLCAAAGRHAETVTLWSADAVQRKAAGIAVSTLEEEHRRERPLRDAIEALGQRRFKAAEDRGAAMTFAAAVDFAVMMTGELVALVAQGRTDAEIAEKLFISVSTVRTHLDRVRDKSGCRRRADLTRLALKEGII